jgi:hypothetical protein
MVQFVDTLPLGGQLRALGISEIAPDQVLVDLRQHAFPAGKIDDDGVNLFQAQPLVGLETMRTDFDPVTATPTTAAPVVGHCDRLYQADVGDAVHEREDNVLVNVEQAVAYTDVADAKAPESRRFGVGALRTGAVRGLTFGRSVATIIRH